MSQTTMQDLSGVAETLFIPLYIRAIESQRPDALLKDEKAQALVAQMATTAVLEERIALAKLMNDMLMQDYVMIPLVHRGDVSAFNNTLLGVRFNSWDSELWNIADWSRAGQ